MNRQTCLLDHAADNISNKQVIKHTDEAPHDFYWEKGIFKGHRKREFLNNVYHCAFLIIKKPGREKKSGI